VMAKPAKPETDAGKRARRSAKELLRKYGQAGTTAFRAVHNEPQAGGGAVAVQGGAYGLTGHVPMSSGYPPQGYPPQGYPAGTTDLFLILSPIVELSVRCLNRRKIKAMWLQSFTKCTR